jgi:hypothetical protein
MANRPGNDEGSGDGLSDAERARLAREFFSTSADESAISRAQVADDLWRVRRMLRGRTVHGTVIIEPSSLNPSSDPLRVALMKAQYRLMGVILGGEPADSYSPFSPVFLCVRAVQSVADTERRRFSVPFWPQSFPPKEVRAIAESLDPTQWTSPELDALARAACLPHDIDRTHLLVALGMLAIHEAVRYLVAGSASAAGFYLDEAARSSQDALVHVLLRGAGAARIQEIKENMRAEVLAKTGAEGGRERHRKTNRMKEWGRAEAKKLSGSDVYIATELEKRLPAEYAGFSSDPYRIFYDDLRLQRQRKKSGTNTNG